MSDLRQGDILFLFDKETEVNRQWEYQLEKIDFEYEIGNSFSFVKDSKVINGTSLKRTIYFPFYVFRKVRRHRPQVILTVEMGLRTIFSLIAGRLYGCKVIIVSDVTADSEVPPGWFKKKLRTLIVKSADGAIARSNNAKSYLLQVGFDAKSVVVARYSNNLIGNPAIAADPHLAELRIESKKFVRERFCFFYCGQFIDRKGLDLLIDAVESLPQPVKERVAFIMAGGTEQQLQELYPGYDKNLFTALGFIQAGEIGHYYNSADCFILPTRADSWGLVVNEAVSQGCPVMLSKYAGSAGELVEDNITGIVFDPLNKQEFINKLMYCIDNKETLRNFSICAKERLKSYSNDNAAKMMADFITCTAIQHIKQ
ncbi:MAG: glycosyltransferase family 4 protein [Chitinophagaceae bacterium]|nr:glycosyltransferase family 4 protein [Chitinophagaceae bacterium]